MLPGQCLHHTSQQTLLNKWNESHIPQEHFSPQEHFKGKFKVLGGNEFSGHMQAPFIAVCFTYTLDHIYTPFTCHHNSSVSKNLPLLSPKVSLKYVPFLHHPTEPEKPKFQLPEISINVKM